jgi:hypothetical protein
MRPLLPKEFLRKFPQRSVLAGAQRKFAELAKRPAFVATVISIGIHGGLALSIPRLLPSSAQEDTAVAIETDVVTLSPTDLAAFSSMATAPAPRSSNSRYTDLNGQTLPNLSASRERDKTANSLTSGSSSFGWDFSNRGSSGSSGSSGSRGSSGSSGSRGSSSYDDDSFTYDATREDEFYEYWQRSQNLLDRFDQGGNNGGGGSDGDGDGEDQKAIAGNNSAGGGAEGGGTNNTDIGLNANAGGGFNSGEPYTTGMAARQSYAVWAIAMQDAKGLSEEELTPIFLPVSIPVPRTAGASRLVGEQGIVGLLVKPDGTPDSADLLSSFSSNELAKSLVREFVLAGFEGCNVGTPRDTWTACGLDITFVAADGSSGTATASGGNAGSSGNAAGNPGGSGNPSGSGNSANASGADTSGQTPNPSATPPELVAVLEGFEPDTPIAIAINETVPAYRAWRNQIATSVGNIADGLVFRAVPSALPYPADLDPEFDRSLPTTAIVSLVINPDFVVIPETATVLRSSGNDQLDAIALGFAENTPRDWYANNLELNGDRGAIVLFTLSFMEAEDDTTTPVETNPESLEVGGEPETPNTTPGDATSETTGESDATEAD